MSSRAVSSVIGVVLMVGVVVILASVVGVFALGTTENIKEPAPTVGQTSGEFEPGPNKQVVRITHIAGDTINVENIEIIVRASGSEVNTEARLVNLPGDGFFTRSLDDSNIEGNEDLIDQSYQSARIVVVEDSNSWSAGQTIEFRVNSGAADFTDDPTYDDADELEVIIVHTPSNSIISEYTFSP